MYDPTVGKFLSEDPLAFDAGDANLSRYVGNSPTDSTDPTGLFKPDQHGAVTRAGNKLAKSSIKLPYIDQIAAAVVGVDFGPKLFDLKYHAQVIEFVDTASLLMRSIQQHSEAYETHIAAKNAAAAKIDIDTIVGNFGQILHIFQDFYSHTDWIEGNRMIPMYEYYRNIGWVKQLNSGDPIPTFFADTGEARLIRLASRPGHGPHATTLDLSRIFGNDPSQLADVIFYGGGYTLTDNDINNQHNRYAADKEGFGRDKVLSVADAMAEVQGHGFSLDVSMVQMRPGIPGSFKRTYDLAAKQTGELIDWLRDNSSECLRKELFVKSIREIVNLRRSGA